jgi:hypothetical protein
MHPIAALQGASGAAIQQALRRFVDRWAKSCRLAGVIERRTGSGARITTQLETIADGSTFPLFQNLGSGSSGCALDATGPIQAGEAVKRQIAEGCDLVVLSKFGKLEAESGSGLLPAFVAAFEHNVPVLTAVAPKYEAAWTRFANPFFTFLPLDDFAIDQWWRTIHAGDWYD